MKYQANPFHVEAHRIEAVRGACGANTALTLESGALVEALPDMMARVNPKVGDFWVIHKDGFVSISPKHVFEKLYRPAKGKKS